MNPLTVSRFRQKKRERFAEGRCRVPAWTSLASGGSFFLSFAVLLFSAAATIAADDVRNRDASEKPADLIAYDSFDYSRGLFRGQDLGLGWKNPWKVSRSAVPEITDDVSPTVTAANKTAARVLKLRGTGARNNPLRRELKQPQSDDDLFVRFDLRYLGEDAPSEVVDPEFFVLWLDRLDGGDHSTHAANVPNIGLHTADRGPKKGRNVFMIRIGPANTSWTKIEVQPNRTYRVVAKLSKSRPGDRADYDRLDMWIDPTPDKLSSPDATVSGAQSTGLIRWIGFSTGVKTEASDRIHIDDLLLTNSWKSVLDDSVNSVAEPEPAGHNGVVWDKPVDFKRDVYPVLKSRCFDCHAGDKPDSGYRLDVYRELLGYSTGEVLAEPGGSRHSRLLEVVAADSEEDRMPPDGDDPLTDQQIAMLKAWIDQGMKWDDKLLPPPSRKSDHWAFQSVGRPDVPHVDDRSWIRTPVDAFIRRRHADAGVTHAAEATKQTLVRRLYLDIIGLPPTPEQVDEFLFDESPKAYEDLVEQLLHSPHYGERWGRYWLDLARWAESQGYQHDIVRPYAWRYRDYVIDSFNADKPYDRFLREQLAGDELEPYSDENVIATGFLAAARISGNQEDTNIQRNDVMVDIVNATGSAVLGLTLECAQCHNHKFDPVSQRDYYRLQAFFVKGQLGNLSLRDSDANNPTDLEKWIPKPAFNFYSKEAKALVRQKLFQPIKEPHTWGYLSAETGRPNIERFPVVNRRPIRWQPASLKQMEARMLIRGDAGNQGPVVNSGWPEVLGATPSSLGDKPRSALVDWMADPQNPLVSRVWVNRLWQYHFGRGIVATPSDFGVEGAKPTHPELLDWLATELMTNGWSTRHIHRQILLSSTYRQERRHNKANAAIDIDNKLLWQWPRRRLEAEAIRDSVLVATGELDRRVGGVSVPPEREEDNLRRTIYLFQQRSAMPSVMEMFDAPEGIASCSRRSVSTVALQPLFMLNSQFMARRATALAEAVTNLASEPDQQIDFAFQRTLSRSPDADERQLAREILSSRSNDQSSLMQLCHALLNLNEFVYIP
ncbi:Planctomycete cytochrome C [Fuerstiella marisgermanici]|uniref:Planctomycete cytochrome C n=1 Tax=Fuerstiella marisgermanici TaxID=1891926 RepID=A0A1P8WNS6_9PLAN|nr:Planctomycete cytochrome C [Fuerstiella marisgermanici]